MNGFQILEFLKTKNWTKWLRMSMKHRLWFICGWLPVVWTRVPRPDDAIRPIFSVYQFVKDVLINLFMLFVQFELLSNRDSRTARFLHRLVRVGGIGPTGSGAWIPACEYDGGGVRWWTTSGIEIFVNWLTGTFNISEKFSAEWEKFLLSSQKWHNFSMTELFLNDRT